MKIKDRILAFGRVKSSELLPDPRNWRTHPTAQADALRGVLAEIGFADAVLARETDAGLMLIGGHLWSETAGVDEAEAAEILATHDSLAVMAEAEAEKLAKLLDDISTGSEAIRSCSVNSPRTTASFRRTSSRSMQTSRADPMRNGR